MSSSDFKTPIHRSPRFDTTPTQSSRPTFNLNAWTPSSVRKKLEDVGAPTVIVIESSNKKAPEVVPSMSSKKKGKEKVDVVDDSDFEDEISILKRFRLNQKTKKGNVTCKSRGAATRKDDNDQPKKPVRKSKRDSAKNPKRTPKDKRKQLRCLNHINFSTLKEISDRLTKLNMLHMFKGSPFGYLLDLPPMHVQPQLIRHLVENEMSSNRKDVFKFSLNGSEIEFGIVEFKAITGFKCGTLDDFVIDLTGPSKLMWKYFPNIKNREVPKGLFITVFRDEDLIEADDIFDMCIIYFISTFIFSSPLQNTFVPEDHFLLVETGKYVNYPWGYLSFLELRDCITKQVAAGTERMMLSGFSLALQIWFYECSNQVDRTVAIHNDNCTPRMFNWQIPDRKIFYQHFRRGMFRPFGNQYKFMNMSFTPVEFAAIRAEELPTLNATVVLEPNEQPRANSEPRNFNGSEDATAPELKDGQNFGKMHTSFQPESKDSEAIQRLEKEIFLRLTTLEAKVDDEFRQMKSFIEESFRKYMSKTSFEQNIDPKVDKSGLQKDCGGKEEFFSKHASGISNIRNGLPTVIMITDKGVSSYATQQDVHNRSEQHVVSCNARNTDNAGMSMLGEARVDTPNTSMGDNYDFPELTDSQLVAIDNQINYVTPMQVPRQVKQGKYT